MKQKPTRNILTRSAFHAIDMEKMLREHPQFVPFSAIEERDLQKVCILQILDCDESRADDDPKRGCYFSADAGRLLLLGASDEQIGQYIACCGRRLRRLEILFADLAFWNASHLENLEELWLYANPIRQLPDSIRNLRCLNNLVLAGLELEELPVWLPELGLPFTRERFGGGICLLDTCIEGVDMSIFDQSQESILQWFEERKRAHEVDASLLNELKVVFLGDGEAGKSHTIARLLNNGRQVNQFWGVATPGIVIKDKDYQIGDQQVKVHFWDFGGQEILHSMHRMFLTKRTLYVVMLNVRDGNQDERARYWLHNLRAFADGAPVMLVLNKMDMNPNASVNEPALRKLYPNLRSIVKLSTLMDSDAEFRCRFVEALLDQISGMDILRLHLPAAWNRLKERLQCMTSNYIFGDEFREFCDEVGVKGTDDVRRDLLNWFSDLGVSFCYSGSASLEDYVILRPDWIINALYIILYNRVETEKNGQVSHETIYRMLSSRDTERIRRTVTYADYNPHEVDYVLKVFRKFRLSFLVDDGIEFFPMLCDPYSAMVAYEYTQDPDTTELRLDYEYLPVNVIHRLMVDMRRDLDKNNVWRFGARFVSVMTGVSAVVYMEGNQIYIIVRSENRYRTAHSYLAMIRDALSRINSQMGLEEPESFLAYKADDQVEYFNYEQLQGSMKHGMTEIYSKRRRMPIPIQDILSQSDTGVRMDKERLLRDVLAACYRLQQNKLYWDASEDDRTTYIRDMLCAGDYFVAGQSLSVFSSKRAWAGELDLDIRLSADTPFAVYEALTIQNSALHMNKWKAHVWKLREQYADSRLAFLTSYVECPRERFTGICQACIDHLRREDAYITSVDVDGILQNNPWIRAVHYVIDGGGVPMETYCIFVRIGS